MRVAKTVAVALLVGTALAANPAAATPRAAGYFPSTGLQNDIVNVRGGYKFRGRHHRGFGRRSIFHGFGHRGFRKRGFRQRGIHHGFGHGKFRHRGFRKGHKFGKFGHRGGRGGFRHHAK